MKTTRTFRDGQRYFNPLSAQARVYEFSRWVESHNTFSQSRDWRIDTLSGCSTHFEFTFTDLAALRKFVSELPRFVAYQVTASQVHVTVYNTFGDAHALVERWGAVS